MSIESILQQVQIISGNSKLLGCCCCHVVSLTPLKSTCGHLFCRDCLTTVSRNGQLTCPVDQTEILLQECFDKPDHKLKVMQLIVKCPNERKGCYFVGKLYEIKQHLTSCGESAVALCPQGCQTSVNTKDLQHHLQNVCPHRYVVCNFCKTPLPYSNFQKHLVECKCYPVMCQLNCGYTFPRDQIAAHAKLCGKQVHKCKFSELGCPFQGEEMNVHQHEQNYEIHMDIILTANLKSKLYVDYALEKMRGDVEELRNENIILKNALDESNDNVEFLKKITGQLCQNVQKAFGRNVGLIGTDQNESEILSDTVTALTAQMREIELLVNNVDQDLQSSKASMKQSLQQQAAQFITPLQVRKSQVCNGRFLWKIPGYIQIYEDAKSGKAKSLISQSFYIQEFGYKMCLELYPNGNGEAEGKYLSIDLLCVKSEEDQILKWPAKFNVNVNLFHPGINEWFSKTLDKVLMNKPLMNYEARAGFQHFIKLDELKHWDVTDDTLILKVRVNVIID